MVFLDATQAENLELREAQLEALRYSNLCRVNIAMIAKLEKLNRDLAEALGKEHQAVLDAQAGLGAMRGQLFGKSSERRVDSDGPLFTNAAAAAEGDGLTKPRKKRKNYGRTPQPELPRVIVDHGIAEAQQKEFGLRPMEGQFEISEMINVTPSRFVVEVHRRQKYVPVNPESAPLEAPVIVTAPGPLRLKEGGRYSPAFGVECGLGKFQWHLPLDRQVRIMKAHGLVVTSQVLFAQIDTIAWYLGNHVMPGILAKIRASRVNQADETYLENLEKDAKSRFWLWSVMNPDAILFEVYDSRSKKAAQTFLKDIEGVLLTDGYYAYSSLASAKLVTANDWSHVRRKFVAAEKTHPAESKEFVDRIRDLFEIEEKMSGKSRLEILGVRQAQSKPIVDAIGEKCRALVEKTLPKSPLGKAIRYTLKLWTGLNVFLDHGDVPLHTNWIERMQRGPVVGRKNYYGMKNLANARMAAIWHSVIQTCILNGVEPRDYINETLRAILSKGRVVMPWDWPKRTGEKPAESNVSKTVVCETAAGLTTKSAKTAAIAVSESIS
jgi:transposase